MFGDHNTSGQYHTYGYDGSGLVRHVLYGSALIAQMNYDPYGNPVQPLPFVNLSTTSPTAFGYIGEPTNCFGVVNLRARYYNPQHGVFTSPDPVLGVVGRSESYNGYGYVEGNPVNFTDPSGKCPWCIPLLLWGLGAGAAAFTVGTVGYKVIMRGSWEESIKTGLVFAPLGAIIDVIGGFARRIGAPAALIGGAATGAATWSSPWAWTAMLGAAGTTLIESATGSYDPSQSLEL
ncbi:MAG: RHS repeat-associated core domain-containing protein [Anaerolineales bacterium]|nr:RHS repeat-associated core domain-containing protein [Anaerolineales bacterium]